MYRILALDPGGTTGWASLTAENVPHPDGYDELLNITWSCGQIGPENHYLKLFNFLGIQQVSDFTVISESFEYRNRARPGLDLSSKEYIGVTQLFCEERNVPLVMQTAGAAKGFVSDGKIKTAHLWFPGQKHAMDATRHLLYYIVDQYNKKKKPELHPLAMSLFELWTGTNPRP